MQANFQAFLASIEPTESETNALKAAHEDLRKRLHEDEDVSSLVDTVFLQGSYRRDTLVTEDGQGLPDIDVVLVTTLDEHKTSPQEALDAFKPFLDREYGGRWSPNNRSVAIEYDDVKLDMVMTAAPNRSEQRDLLQAFSANDASIANASFASVLQKMETESAIEFMAMAKAVTKPIPTNWRDYPLKIPDRHVETWEATNPMAQVTWTSLKNARTAGDYVRVTKALKWWRRHWRSRPNMPPYPKGYPFEHIIGECCPNGASISFEERLTLTLEGIRDRFMPDVQAGRKPALQDRGVKKHDVLKRVTVEQFRDFHSLVAEAAIIARRAMALQPEEAAPLWRSLFGPKFPAGNGGTAPRKPPPLPPTPSHGFKAPSQPSRPQGERFA